MRVAEITNWYFVDVLCGWFVYICAKSRCVCAESLFLIIRVWYCECVRTVQENNMYAKEGDKYEKACCMYEFDIVDDCW